METISVPITIFFLNQIKLENVHPSNISLSTSKLACPGLS